MRRACPVVSHSRRDSGCHGLIPSPPAPRSKATPLLPLGAPTDWHRAGLPTCARDVGESLGGTIMLTRRDAMLQLGQSGLGALTLPGLLRAEGERAVGRARAKSCILLFLWGGPPQQDLWDMKPDAPTGIRSHFKPI